MRVLDQRQSFLAFGALLAGVIAGLPGAVVAEMLLVSGKAGFTRWLVERGSWSPALGSVLDVIALAWPLGLVPVVFLLADRWVRSQRWMLTGILLGAQAGVLLAADAMHQVRWAY